MPLFSLPSSAVRHTRTVFLAVLSMHFALALAQSQSTRSTESLAPATLQPPSSAARVAVADNTRLVVTLQPSVQPASSLSGAKTRAQALLLSLKSSQPLTQKPLPEVSLVKTLGSGQWVLGATDKRLPREDAQRLAQALSRDPRVVSVELDVRVKPTSRAFAHPGHEPLWGYQWALHSVADAKGAANLEPLWQATKGDGAVIAVLDTGIVAHPELQGRVAGGFDFVSDPKFGGDGDGRDPDASDPGDFCEEGGLTPSSWHGTLVSALAVGLWDAQGMAGVLPQAQVLSARVLGRCGGWLSDVADAVRWSAGAPVASVPAHGLKVQVLNLSLGSEPGISCPSYMQSAISAAREKGSLVVVAAGNESAPTLGSPANCSGVLAVAAHTRSGDLTEYTNDDPRIVVSGPAGGPCRTQSAGVCNAAALVSAHNKGERTVGANGYAYVLGTSVAAPHVSAVLAALKLQMPGLGSEQARELLKTHSRPFETNSACAHDACGYGMLDAGLLQQGLALYLTPSLEVGVEPAWPRRGERVELSALALLGSQADAQALIQWQQLSGPPVALETGPKGTSFLAPNTVGELRLRAQATYSSGAQRVADVTVRVVAGTAPRLIPGQTSFNMKIGQGWTWSPEVLDDENNFTRLVLLQAPAGMKAEGKTLSWPRPLPGFHTAVVTAEDSEGLRSAAHTLEFTVEGTLSEEAEASSGGKGSGQSGGLLALLLAAALGQRWNARRRLRA